jgi:hypothetical protein
MELRFACPQCGTLNRQSGADQCTVLTCQDCSYVGLMPIGWTIEGEVERCPICGCDGLFKQKDFRQRTGALIALVGAALALFTKYVTLILAALINLALYATANERLVCYVCRTQIVGHRPTSRHRRYDVKTENALQSKSRASRQEQQSERIDQSGPTQ